MSFAVKNSQNPTIILHMRNLVRYFFLALVLLVVALVSALTAMRLAIHGREVTVPDLKEKTPVEARRIAEDAGLAAQVENNYYSPTIPEGKVLSQVPPSGTVVRRGWEVRLALSLGPQRVAIPQVVGNSDRAAAINIAQRGLELSSTARVQISNATAGQVLAQNPPANAADISAPKVSLLVVDDAPPQVFVMPSFVGQPLGSVRITLQNAGFSVGKVTMAPAVSPPEAGNPALQVGATQGGETPRVESSPAEPSAASFVVSQEPAPGAKVLVGAAINFVVK